MGEKMALVAAGAAEIVAVVIDIFLFELFDGGFK